MAFRRDGDEEHREPRFELPIPAGPNLVTAQGLALIDATIATLTDETADAIGDRVEAIARELRYWKTRRATAVETASPIDGTVGFGSVVDIVLNGTARTITLVGGDEAEPHAGRLAFSAPLARALLGTEAGDVVAFAGRDGAIEVVAIR